MTLLLKRSNELLVGIFIQVLGIQGDGHKSLIPPEYANLQNCYIRSQLFPRIFCLLFRSALPVAAAWRHHGLTLKCP